MFTFTMRVSVSKTSIAKMYMPIALKILNRSLMLLAYKLCLYEIESLYLYSRL